MFNFFYVTSGFEKYPVACFTRTLNVFA